MKTFAVQHVGAQPHQEIQPFFGGTLSSLSRFGPVKPALFVAPRCQFRVCNTKLYLGRILAINNRLILTIA
jgi:hypothetical protein